MPDEIQISASSLLFQSRDGRRGTSDPAAEFGLTPPVPQTAEPYQTSRISSRYERANRARIPQLIGTHRASTRHTPAGLLAQSIRPCASRTRPVHVLQTDCERRQLITVEAQFAVLWEDELRHRAELGRIGGQHDNGSQDHAP